MAISIITIDGESYDVGASAGNVAFNNSGTGISAGTVQGAIEEVKLTPGDNITIEDGVISATGGGGGGGYEPPVGGIPKTDLSGDVQDTLDLADKALQSESDPVFAASAAHGITSTDINNWNNKANSAAIPTKTSDLTNDSGFITDEDIEDFVTADDIEEIVMGSADVSVVEANGYINIVFATASITFSPDTTMSLYSGQKTGTLTVSGTHLKQDITLTVPSGFTAQVSGGTAAQSITIPQTDGEVSGVSVTITYTGADSGSYTGSITATSGSVTASVGLVYSQYQGATIIAGTIDTIKAAIGSSQIGELNVSGVNLEDDISASIGNGDFTICATQNGTYGTMATISKSSAEASGGATLFVKYTPSSGTSTASDNLTLTTPRNGVNMSKTVTLTGAVSTLTLSTNSVSISTDQGVAATGTFTIQGSNLTNGVTLVLTDANSVFSLSKNSLTKAEAEAGETITVTYNSSAAGNHSGSIEVNWDGTTQTISLSGTAAAATMSDAEGKFTKEINGKTIYFKRLKVNDEFTNNVGVYNSDYNTSSASSTLYSGAISIPATVACDGTTYNVTTIADYAFGNCTGLTSLTIAEGITTINTNAIRGCTNNSFTSLTIPNSVTSLGQNNLFGCSKLTNIVIGDGVTAIGQYFDTQGTISNIIIGSSVASIAQYSTIKMSDTGTVTIKRTTPPSTNGVVFKTSGGSYPCNATLRVPLEAVDTYKTRPTWGVNGSGAVNWHQFNPDNIVAISE